MAVTQQPNTNPDNTMTKFGQVTLGGQPLRDPWVAIVKNALP